MKECSQGPTPCCHADPIRSDQEACTTVLHADRTAQTLPQYGTAYAERVDRWRTLTRLARSLRAAHGVAAELVQALELMRQLQPIKALPAVPGPAWQVQVQMSLARTESLASGRLAKRMGRVLASRRPRRRANAAHCRLGSARERPQTPGTST